MKHVYFRAADGAPVADEEAVDGNGILRPGYGQRGAIMLRDSAAVIDGIAITDAIDIADTCFPGHGFGPATRRLTGMAQSDDALVLDQVAQEARAKAGQLATMADGLTGHRLSEAQRRHLRVAGEHLSGIAKAAAARVAKASGTPMPGMDAATAYPAYVDRLSNAWRA